MKLLQKLYPLIFLLAGTNATGIGKAWRVLPYKTDYWNHPSWPRLDSSAFEVRTVSGVGHLVPYEEKTPSFEKINLDDPNSLPSPKDQLTSNKKPEHSHIDRFERLIPNPLKNPDSNLEITDEIPPERIFKPGLSLLQSEAIDDLAQSKELIPRIRRDAENETLEKVTTTKNVRDVRLNSPESWSTQPISVEFRHRTSLDQMIQQAEDEDDSHNTRSHHVPRVDFVTSHHRRSYEHREPRDMVVTKNYEDYDSPWYRNTIRDREYEAPSYRRGMNYYYPDRYRMERDYYMRLPNDQYYYDRYRDEDFDLYGRSRPTPKPKRIIYYATLPEIVRKPVDLRNYPRTYDGLLRSPVSRDGGYKRVPGNVDPGRYRYRNVYDSYDPYSKRSSYFDRPYGYQDDENRRKVSLQDSVRNGDALDVNNDRKLGNQITVRNEGKLPWPVQIGTEVSVKDDDRVSGRKVFGESNGFERFHSAQLQKAPDATGSSELQSDN